MNKETYAILELIILLLIFDVTGFGIGWWCRGRWGKRQTGRSVKFMDREKIIKGIKCHRQKLQTTNAVSCLECPYSEPNPIREWCMKGLMDDIYTLLKEQDAEIDSLNVALDNITQMGYC